MARFIFPDLSTFRKRVAYNYDQHRKTINENLGLIIALLASAAAVWSGYEAHKSRQEARNAADKSLAIQQQSVDAQIEAMRLEQRPYVEAQFQNLSFGFDGYSFNIRLTSKGNTPAVNVHLLPYCTNKSDGEEVLDFKTLPQRPDLQSTEKQNPLNTQYLMPQSSTSVPCNIQELSLSSRVIGVVSYTDLFNQNHHTPFCFHILVPGFAEKQFPRKPLISPNDVVASECYQAKNYPAID
jgi:hypothetical protein